MNLEIWVDADLGNKGETIIEVKNGPLIIGGDKISEQDAVYIAHRIRRVMNDYAVKYGLVGTDIPVHLNSKRVARELENLERDDVNLIVH